MNTVVSASQKNKVGQPDTCAIVLEYMYVAQPNAICSKQSLNFCIVT